MKRVNKKIYTYIQVILLIIIVFLSIKVTKRATNSVIEGDASAEIVLSYNLFKNHLLFSKDWRYPNELQIFLQLFFTPLFNLFSDWSTVRFAGTLIMHFCLILSFVFMMKKANQSKNAIILGIILLLLPYCVVYGRIALYQVMYLPNIIISFIFVGLFFSVMKSNSMGKTKVRNVYMLLLFVFTFLVCMTGIRFISEILLPILVLYFLSSFIKNNFQITNNKDTVIWCISLAGTITTGLAGYLVSKNTIMKLYGIGDNSSKSLSIKTFPEPSIWKCILHQFGFRINIDLMSILGLFSLAGIFVAFYIFFASIYSYTEKSPDVYTMVLRRMMLVSFVIVALEMCFLNNLEITPRYYISSSVWMIPLLCSCHDHFFEEKAISPRKLAYFCCIGIIAANGLLNMSFFLNPDGIAKQPYEGLPITNPNMIRDLKRSLEFIEKNEYQFGYAPYWEATTITEKTNGLPVGGFTVEGDKIVPAQMLTLRSYDTLPADKVFLLLDVTNAQYFPDFDVSFEWSEVYRDIHYVIYDIPNLEHMREYLSQQN